VEKGLLSFGAHESIAENILRRGRGGSLRYLLMV
jgi:hypothetical protein